MFFGAIVIHAEAVTLNTPFEEETSMLLPATLEKSHALLIRVAELYWGERFDLENSLENVEQLTGEVNSLLDDIDRLEAQNTGLIGLLEEASTRRGLSMLTLGVNADVIGNPVFPLQLGMTYEMFVFNWLTLGLQVEYPFTFGITIGTAW